MKLSRRVPSQVKTVHFIWCKRDFMEMSDRYREIRSKAGRKLDSCHWCKHKFKNGEMMALAQIEESKANKLFCQSCIDEADGGESDETVGRSWGDARNTLLQKNIDVMRDFLSTLEKDEWARWVEFSQAARHKETTDE